MKKALKVLAVIGGVLILLLVVIAILLINKLPSTYQMKQAISPKQPAPQFASSPEPPDSSRPPEQLPFESRPSTTAKAGPSSVDDAKELSRKALYEDFLNDRQPLASVCGFLDRASESKFLRADQNANSKEFAKKLTDPVKDPLIEAAAPTFRFIMRRPAMRTLIEMVERAEANHDKGFLSKAGFLAQAFRVGNDLRASKNELDAILMKSYNLYILSKAVGKNPALARDPATLGFCEQIEKNLNNDLEFNADLQAQELENFLDYAKVSPEEIGYDPKYRSNARFNLSNQSIRLENIWIEKLFAEDLKKAGKEIEKSLPPPEEKHL